jgi:hypothetical protein
MATVDTIQRRVQGPNQNDIAPLLLGTSTTETAFSTNGLVIAGTTVIAAAPAVIRLPDQGAIPSMWDSTLNTGLDFRIRIKGNAVTGTTTNLTLKLYQVPSAIISAGTAATLSNDNVIATSTARAVNSTTGIFLMETKMNWNSTTRILQGTFTATINNLTDAWAATTAVTTAAASSTVVPVGQLTAAADNELNFLLSATLSSGNAANVVNLMEIAVGPM